MIIDSHLHLLKAENFDKELWEKNHVEPPTDTPIEVIINWFKQAGIQKAIIMGQDMTRIWNSSCGEDYILEIAKKYPDIFIPLASIEPIDKMGRFNKLVLDYLESAVNNGFKGILLTPPYGQYNSNDRRIYPIYEFAQQKKIIVQFHHGAIFGPPILGQLKYTSILNLNDVIVDFPELKIVVEHLAFPWVEQLMVLMANHSNIYSDLALLYDQKFLTAWRLVMAKEYKIIDRIMYASDYWSSPGGVFDIFEDNIKRWITYLKEDVNKICCKSGWPTLKKEEIEGIIWRNATELYNLKI
ncbi:MAG: amidohydrolase family protein [Candidatus Humimicrobiaceae bacterium]